MPASYRDLFSNPSFRKIYREEGLFFCLLIFKSRKEVYRSIAIMYENMKRKVKQFRVSLQKSTFINIWLLSKKSNCLSTEKERYI